MMQGLLNPRKASELQEIQEAKAIEFTSRLAGLSTNLREHVRWCCVLRAIAIIPAS